MQMGSPAMAAPKPPAMPPMQVPGYPNGAPELHGIKKVLSTVGSILPWTQPIMPRIPGTPENYQMQEQGANRRFNEDAIRTQRTQENTQRQQAIEGEPGKVDLNRRNVESEIAARENKPVPKGDKKVDEGYNAQGQRVVRYEKADGTQYNSVNADIVQKEPADANKLAGEIEAQVGAKPTTPQFGGKQYPSVGAAQKAWGAEAEKIKNREAEAGANARGAAFGRNRPVQVLDTFNGNRPVTVSAGDAEDNPSRYVTQSGGEKALPREALINDIRVSSQNVEKNLDVLNAKGLDRAALAAALGDPNTTFQSYLQAVPRGMLDDRGQQFVSDLFNLREQAMAMRSVLGAGAGSEDMRRAILSTLPGIASPDANFARKQIRNLQQVLDRVEQGVPNVPLRGGPNDKTPAPGAPQGTGALPPGWK